jgi:alpha-galactosidase
LRALAAMSMDQLAHLLLQQPSLTATEQRAHLSMWAMLSAPLIAGNDVRSMSAQTRDILTNRDVIAVDQDPLVAPARPLPGDGRVLTKPLSGAAAAVAFVNPTETPINVTLDAGETGVARSPCYTVRDLWAHTDATTTGAIASGALPAHTVALRRVNPGCRR